MALAVWSETRTRHSKRPNAQKGEGAAIGCAGGENDLPARGGQIIITIIVDGVQRGPNTAGEAQAVAAGEL